MLTGVQQHEAQGDDQVMGPTEPLVGPVESIRNKMHLLLYHSVMFYSSWICCAEDDPPPCVENASGQMK